MKNMFVVIMLIFSTMLFAQVDTSIVEPSTDVLINSATDFVQNLLTSIGSVAGGILFIFGFFNDKILKKPMNDTWTQISTWILAVMFGWVGYYFNLGVFADVGIVWSIVLAIASGLVANGLFALEKVQQFLAFLGVIYPKVKDRTNK